MNLIVNTSLQVWLTKNSGRSGFRPTSFHHRDGASFAAGIVGASSSAR